MAITVLMFGWEFPPFHVGGLGVACYGLTRALSAAGVNVLFALPDRLDLRLPFLTFLFADPSPPPSTVGGEHRTALDPYATVGWWEAPRRDYVASARHYAGFAHTLAAAAHFDVIHAHDWLCFEAGLEAKRVSGKPLVVHVHATEYDRSGGRGANPHVFAIEKAGMEGADVVVTVSRFTKANIVRHYEIPPEKVRVIHNGVDLTFMGTPARDVLRLRESGQPIVLFAGRITLQKGPEYFVRAARRVLEVNSSVRFVVAGTGDMEHQMISEAARLGIADRVLFTGFLSGKDLATVYRSADLFVMPSVSEPFGISALDALAYGTPVLISRQSGVSEVLRHVLKVDFWDLDDIADKILAVLRYPVLHRLLRSQGQAESRRHTWKASAEKCMDLYLALQRG